MEPEEKEQCSNCRFSARNSHYGDTDKCRRHAPVVVKKYEDDSFKHIAVGVWPGIHGSDWCGDYEREEDPKYRY